MRQLWRFLPICIIVLCSFKRLETAIRIEIRNGVTSLTIFPLKDDSSFYIKRKFDRNTYCREEVYSGGKRILLTTLTFSKDKTSYDEFVFSHDDGVEKVVQIQENINTAYAPLRKHLPIRDSTSFEIHYYPSGRIKSCAVETSFCKKYNGFEFSEDNTQYSTGNFSTQVRYDTVSLYEKGVESFAIRRFCGEHTGIWRTFNLKHELIGTRRFDD